MKNRWNILGLGALTASALIALGSLGYTAASANQANQANLTTTDDIRIALEIEPPSRQAAIDIGDASLISDTAHNRPGKSDGKLIGHRKR